MLMGLADLMAPGGETQYGYSVFMKLQEGLGVARRMVRARTVVIQDISLVPRQ
jgi:hypothetical protein